MTDAKLGIKVHGYLNPGCCNSRDGFQISINPYKLKTLVAQVWIRIYELSVEYWDLTIILGIVRAIGTPIKLDNQSLHGSFGHYVWVLVEINMASPLQEQVMLERTRYSTFVSISFERLLDFCPFCNLIGYSTAFYKRFRPREVPDTTKWENIDRSKSNERMVFRCKDTQKVKTTLHVDVDKSVPQNLSSHHNSFKLLSEEAEVVQTDNIGVSTNSSEL